ALSAARKAAKAMSCMSQLRQMGVGEYAYAQDHDGHLTLSFDSSATYSPSHGSNWYWYRGPWTYRLRPYVVLKQPKGTLSSFEGRKVLVGELFRCPAKPNWTLHSKNSANYISYA